MGFASEMLGAEDCAMAGFFKGVTPKAVEVKGENMNWPDLGVLKHPDVRSLAGGC